MGRQLKTVLRNLKLTNFYTLDCSNQSDRY